MTTDYCDVTSPIVFKPTILCTAFDAFDALVDAIQTCVERVVAIGAVKHDWSNDAAGALWKTVAYYR